MSFWQQKDISHLLPTSSHPELVADYSHAHLDNTQQAMIHFFDTETTGVPRNYKAPASDLENWPRLVQLAWILADEDGVPIEEVETIIRPDGFTIPSDATAA